MKKHHPSGERGLVPGFGSDIDDDFAKFPFPRFAAKIMHKALSEPVIDVFETKDEVVSTIELPGVKKEDISLKISPSALMLQVRQGHSEEKHNAAHYEYSARFEGHSQTVSLPSRVVSSKAKATYKNGVLEVRIPKEKQANADAGSVKID